MDNLWSMIFRDVRSGKGILSVQVLFLQLISYLVRTCFPNDGCHKNPFSWANEQTALNLHCSQMFKYFFSAVFNDTSFLLQRSRSIVMFKGFYKQTCCPSDCCAYFWYSCIYKQIFKDSRNCLVAFCVRTIQRHSERATVAVNIAIYSICRINVYILLNAIYRRCSSR